MNSNSRFAIWFRNMKDRFGEIKWKEIFTGRGAIALGSVLLICVIVAAVAIMGNGEARAVGNEESTKTLGQSVLVGLEVSEIDADTADYFTSATINRDKVRNEAMAVLQQIADNPDVLPDTKDDTLASIAKMASEMQIESNIETLVKAKGFNDCIAVFSEGSCTVVVRSEGLLESEVAQILEIVVTEAGITPENVKIRKS